MLNAWIVLLLITSSTNGYDGSMMNGLQSLDQWNDAFNHPKGGKLGLLNAIQNIGALAAYPLAPYLSDGLGRRMTIFIGAFIMVGATILQSQS
jgi:MFS family permease